MQKRAIVTLDKIILGAADVFFKVGYDAASIAAIAEAAGATKGALYFHFSSKEELARAVIDQGHRVSSLGAQQILETTDSPVETMMLMCADLANGLVNDPLVRAGIRLTTGGPIFDPPTRAPYDDWLQTFEELARRAVGAGELAPGTDPAKLAHFIIPSFTGIQLLSDVLTNMEDLMERVREMWEFLLPSVAAPDRLGALSALVPEVFVRRDGAGAVR